MPGAYPTLHTCTASVIRSRPGNLILTAAHCLQNGSDAGYTFVPGYHDGQAPYGVWKTTAAFGAAKWLHQGKASTQRDFAILRVANHAAHGKDVTVQDVVGGNRLGRAPTAGEKVRVPGYVLGSVDKPITCRAPVYLHHGFPAFNCGGYAGGVSGSAWLRGHGKVRTVVGVIGGLHQGGCTNGTSYSSPLGRAVHAVRKRAVHQRHGDNFPTPPSDGC